MRSLLSTLTARCYFSVPAASPETSLSWVVPAEDGNGFVLKSSDKPLVPWGFNYDRDYKVRLLEEYWNEEWDTVAEHFLKMQQLGEKDNPNKDIVLYKFDEFAQQILKDKYALSKLRDYIDLILDTKDADKLGKRNRALIHEFELRTMKYYYSDNAGLHIATILEGGGRNQIRTFGQYLLQRKLKPVLFPVNPAQ